MGFIVDASLIFIGGLLGGIFKKKIDFKNFSALSIGIMLISIVGILENILSISDGKIVGEHVIAVTIALIVGSLIGDGLKLEEKLYTLSKTNGETNGFIEAVLFFSIGGLQISGPILFAETGDSFQLILKGIIDFPFALILGATYGKKVSLSAFVVVIIQLIIAGLAYLFGSFISESLVCQICSLGYLILFFSGFNLICSPQNKIKNINIIPGIFLIIVYTIIVGVFI